MEVVAEVEAAIEKDNAHQALKAKMRAFKSGRWPPLPLPRLGT
jgi:hypothetical protein